MSKDPSRQQKRALKRLAAKVERIETEANARFYGMSVKQYLDAQTLAKRTLAKGVLKSEVPTPQRGKLS